MNVSSFGDECLSLHREAGKDKGSIWETEDKRNVVCFKLQRRCWFVQISSADMAAGSALLTQLESQFTYSFSEDVWKTKSVSILGCIF